MSGSNETVKVTDIFDSTDAVWNQIVPLAAVAAQQTHRLFRNWSDVEDLQQAACEYAFTRQDKVREFLYEENSDGDWEPRSNKDTQRQGETAMITFMRRHCVRLARKDKAKALGYMPEDEYFYTPALVESLIKVWGTGDYELAGQILDPNQSGAKRTSKPANEGNDMLAMIADVGSAMRRLELRDYSVLMQRYCDGQTLHQIGEFLEVSPQRVEQISQRAVRKVIEFLGGRNPH